jgi:large subunit ribosomal protein L19
MKAKKLTKETIAQLGVYERDFPDFNVGDTIAVSQRIKEGDKERIQVFQGDVIAKKGSQASKTFMVRKIGADSIAVERIFPYYAPFVEKIKIVKRGKVRRAKLYYLRERIGRAARIKEIIKKKETKKPAPKAAAPVTQPQPAEPVETQA